MVRIPVASLFLLAAGTALAAPTAEEAEAARKACADAFITSDAAAWQEAALTMTGWGIIEDQDLQREVGLCLSYGAAIPGLDIAAFGTAAEQQAAVLAAQDPTQPRPQDPRLAPFLAQSRAASPDMARLAADIVWAGKFAPTPGPDRDALEEALLAYVRPIPASEAQVNLMAYRALARLDPENAAYAERVERYTAVLAKRERDADRAVRDFQRRLITTTEAFDGSSWARHPSSPRYQDIRNYVTLYLINDGKGRKSMEFFVNYTSDSWLFVENAQINIDGATSRLPVRRWFRDNDTEIWEFGSITGPQAIEIARQIADADRAVIRFNGQQFHDDFVVPATDKKVLREMLDMWGIIRR